jgi:hypothetical protein
MKGFGLLGNALIILTVIIVVKMYLDSDHYNLKCIVSDEDGKKYCVRDGHKIQEAADLLARVSGKMKELVKYMGNKYPDRENVKRLVKNFNPQKIVETLPTDELTAYSENKGEKLAFCLRKTKKGKKLVNEHLLTFVAIHELSHVMSKNIGHGSEFWENFKFLLINAEKSGIHQPKDYKKNSEVYCGMTIHDNPYYDL